MPKLFQIPFQDFQPLVKVNGRESRKDQNLAGFLVFVDKVGIQIFLYLGRGTYVSSILFPCNLAMCSQILAGISGFILIFYVLGSLGWCLGWGVGEGSGL